MLCSNHSAYGFNNFFPSIAKGFSIGSQTVTLVLTAPAYLVGTVISFALVFSSDRNKERGLHISVPLCFAVVGFIITVSTLSKAARYFASFLYVGGLFGSNAIVYTWAASTLNQTPAKRACATAVVNIMSQMVEYLFAVFLSAAGCAEIYLGNVADDGVLSDQYLHLYLYEDRIEARE